MPVRTQMLRSGLKGNLKLWSHWTAAGWECYNETICQWGVRLHRLWLLKIDWYYVPIFHEIFIISLWIFLGANVNLENSKYQKYLRDNLIIQVKSHHFSFNIIQVCLLVELAGQLQHQQVLRGPQLSDASHQTQTRSSTGQTTSGWELLEKHRLSSDKRKAQL